MKEETHQIVVYLDHSELVHKLNRQLVQFLVQLESISTREDRVLKLV